MLEDAARHYGREDIRISLHIDYPSRRRIIEPLNASKDFSLSIKAESLSENSKKSHCILINTMEDIESNIYRQRARAFFDDFKKHWL